MRLQKGGAITAITAKLVAPWTHCAAFEGHWSVRGVLSPLHFSVGHVCHKKTKIPPKSSSPSTYRSPKLVTKGFFWGYKSLNSFRSVMEILCCHQFMNPSMRTKTIVALKRTFSLVHLKKKYFLTKAPQFPTI